MESKAAVLERRLVLKTRSPYNEEWGSGPLLSANDQIVLMVKASVCKTDYCGFDSRSDLKMVNLF